MSNFVKVPYQDGKHWVIYDASQVSKPKRGKSFFVGFSLLALAFLVVSSFLSPVLWAEARYHFWRFEDEKLSLVSQKFSLFGELLWLNTQGVISPADWNFSLIIPKIHLNAKVVKEVDASDGEAYAQALKEGLAHAQGSGYPDQEKLVYIFGHSTNFLWNVSSYNALFYLLDKLEEGDKVSLFYQGRHYAYQVSKKEVTSPSDLSSLSFASGKKLVLSTCWPPGTTWRRLVIIALPETSSQEEVLSTTALPAEEDKQSL